MDGVEKGECIRWLLYVHVDSRVEEKGGVKHLEGFLRAELLISTSEHLRLQRWGQALILNIIRVYC